MGYQKSEKSFTEMLIESKWQKKAKEAPGVFENLPEGHRCITSCVWITNDGFWEASAHTNIPKETVRAELVDVANRIRDRKQSEKLLDIARDGDDDTVLAAVQAARYAGYPEYTWPHGSRYARLMFANWRPGWGMASWAML